MAAIIFSGDDQAYHDWLKEHPHGFVVNTRQRRFDPSYLVLHRATCRDIGAASAHGGYTERAYIKICADEREQLADYLSRKTGRDRPFSKLCKHCKPEDS